MKFIIDNLGLIIPATIALISGSLLFWPMMRDRGPKASPLQTTQFINQGKTLILDIRPAAQFAEGHLRDARNIPFEELEKRLGELNKAKNKTIIVVCQTGAQSSKAVPKLLAAGFAQTYRLEGGLAAWQAQSLPLIKENRAVAA